MTNSCCCIEGSALVLMADGSERPLRDIRPGDLVRTETGSARVSNVLSGAEPYLIHIEFERHGYLDATGGHPLFSDEGIKRCDEVNRGDLLRTQDACVPVKSVTLTERLAKVCNLSFEEESSFFANGLLVGDFALQSRLATRARR